MRVTKTYFMVNVRDMTRAVAFYRSALGLHLRFESPDWSELVWGDATIALHGGGTQGGPTGLGFEVDNLEAACDAVRFFGGRVVVAPRDRPGEPIRLADVADPDGNRFSLAEPAT